jgi:hypothetical protein
VTTFFCILCALALYFFFKRMLHDIGDMIDAERNYKSLRDKD